MTEYRAKCGDVYALMEVYGKNVSIELKRFFENPGDKDITHKIEASGCDASGVIDDLLNRQKELKQKLKITGDMNVNLGVALMLLKSDYNKRFSMASPVPAEILKF